MLKIEISKGWCTANTESPLETLDYTIHIGSTPTFLYFDFVSLLCLRSTLRLFHFLYFDL